jgi:hypothetical protein
MTVPFGNDWKPIEECDVSDKELLALYRYYLKRWHKMLLGEDIHAIWRQIAHILITDLEFRTISEAKRINNEKNRTQNEIIHRSIINGYVFSQYIRIRRITENPSRYPDKDVYSLPTIIYELNENLSVITRENYVCCTAGCYNAKNDRELIEVEESQKIFDILSKKGNKSRNRKDQIDIEFIENLKKYLSITEFHKLNEYVNKFLVHSAAPNNRAPVDLFPFQDMDKIYSNICHVTKELCEKILYCSHEFLPEWLYDPLEFIDQPIVAKDDIENIRKYWDMRLMVIKGLYTNKTENQKDNTSQ